MATATAEPRSVTTVSGDGHKHKKNALSDGQGRLAYILLAPTLLVILVVAGIPVVMSIRESFFQTNTGVDPITGLVAGGEKFVGLGNFTDIFAGHEPGRRARSGTHRPLLERLPEHHGDHRRLRDPRDRPRRGRWR